MGLKTDKRTIGEFTYSVNQLPYSEGRALMPILLRALGPTLGTLLEGMGSKGLESNLDLSRALGEFSSSLSEHDLTVICNKMAERSWILDGPKHNLACDEQGRVHLPAVEEEHWPSRYSDWVKWLTFTLEVNFSSFLGGMGSVSGALSSMAKGASASQSQSTSTGDSGES